jgi:hypothetical protein
MKKTNHKPLKLSIEILRNLSLAHVSGGAKTDPPLPSGCRATCITILPTTGTVISKP